jgi:hypothetical protein
MRQGRSVPAAAAKLNWDGLTQDEAWDAYDIRYFISRL